MKSRLPLLLILALAALLLISCEREKTPIGGEGAAPGSQPKYDLAANTSSTPALSNIAEVGPDAPEAPLDGSALYSANCSACHQISGKGVPAAFPPLDGSPYVTGDNVERMASIMIYGLQGPIKVLGQEYNSVMAPLGRLSDKELAAIATYTRSAWSNKAGAVEAKVFEDARAKHGTRAMFTISELGEES